jgi:hypothetical protein
MNSLSTSLALCTHVLHHHVPAHSLSLPQPTPRPSRSPGPSHRFLSSDWSAFWPSIFATFVGAFLALVTAFYLDRISRRRRAALEKKGDAGRRKAVSALVVAELQRNSAELTTIRTSLERGLVSAAAPTLNVWHALSTEILSYNPDPDVVSVYYKLERVTRLLTLYQDESGPGPQGIHRAVTAVLPELKSLISQILNDCEILIPKLTSTTCC